MNVVPRPHNPKVVSSNLAPATNTGVLTVFVRTLVFLFIITLADFTNVPLEICKKWVYNDIIEGAIF